MFDVQAAIMSFIASLLIALPIAMLVYSIMVDQSDTGRRRKTMFTNGRRADRFDVQVIHNVPARDLLVRDMLRREVQDTGDCGPRHRAVV